MVEVNYKLYSDIDKIALNENDIMRRTSPNMRSTSKAIKLINYLTFQKMS